MASAVRTSAWPERQRERDRVADDGTSPARLQASAHEHAVQFYDDEAFLATAASEFLASGLTSNRPVVVIATPSHRKAFFQRLRELEVDVDQARKSGQLTVLDARQTLKKISVNEEPDARRFQNVIGSVIGRSLAGREGSHVCAYGEMVDLLWKGGHQEGAIKLEELWNELTSKYELSLFCAYNMGNFGSASDSEQFAAICQQHTHVIPTERYVQGDDAARLVAALQDRELELRDVLENAAEGIHRVGPDGIIQWANNSELELLGYRAEEYIGRHITEFHADADVIDDLLARLSCGQAVHSYPARLRHKDGSIRHVLVNSNVRFENGRFLNTRCFTRDITELHEAGVEREAAMERERVARESAERAKTEAEQATADAQRARALAEQANRAKSDFLAVMSHELRTPLNAIGGYAELIELGIHGPITPAQGDALERIQRSQRLLLGLVNQVLNYARVETGNVRYNLECVKLDEVLRTAEGSVASQMRAKNIRYEYTGCDSTLDVQADAEKLQQIVLNLLTNAVKFTDAGGAIGVSIERRHRVAAVHVTDTGIGIPADKFDVIFDPFVQVDARYTRTRDGVGLGLAISRDLARGMGGNLALTRSAEEVGSTFTLTLPLSA
jgi:PAS domain S-box-containing protein